MLELFGRYDIWKWKARIERINFRFLKWANDGIICCDKGERRRGKDFKEKKKSVIDLKNLRYLWYECGEIH